MIPKIVHRVIPETLDAVFEGYWLGWQRLHPGWEFLTWRDRDEARLPISREWLSRCKNGGARSDLIRLEVLAGYGGIYLDADVEPVRALDPLLSLDGFAAWQDESFVGSAVLGSRAGHPALQACLEKTIDRIAAGEALVGPYVATEVLPGRSDWLLLPPGSFYPYPFTAPGRARENFAALPWCFGIHRWAGSWAR